MEKIKLTFSHQETIAHILLSDGKGNVLDHIMMDELQEVLNTLAHASQLKLILIKGNGKHFSFGASVEEHRKETAGTMLRSFHKLFYSLRDLAVPTAAIVSGKCLGGGMELALMSNFIFADETASFGQPEIILGVFPPPASVILAEKIGLARAEELLITGRTFSAKEALNTGLVTQLFSDAETMQQAVTLWAETHILPKSASSLRYAVRSSRIKFNHVLSNFLPQLESIYINELMNTNDANEGIGAFIEKRTPVWENK